MDVRTVSLKIHFVDCVIIVSSSAFLELLKKLRGTKSHAGMVKYPIFFQKSIISDITNFEPDLFDI